MDGIASHRIMAPPLLVSLPLETLLHIADYLDKKSIAAFANTCKTMYRNFSLRTISPTFKGLSFVTLQEMANPGMYFCHACHSLHAWDPAWRVQPYEPDKADHFFNGRNSGVALDNCWPMKFMLYKAWLPCPYPFARLVMKRHFFGPEHGLPIQALETAAVDVVRFDGVKQDESLQARIVGGDQLMLKISITARYTGSLSVRNPRRLLNAWAKSHRVNFCGHMSMPYVVLNHDPRDTTDYKLCSRCKTDVRIRSNWPGLRTHSVPDKQENHDGWTIMFEAYRFLGNCRGHPDMMSPVNYDGSYFRRIILGRRVYDLQSLWDSNPSSGG